MVINGESPAINQLVWDYLCSKGFTQTAKAFEKESGFVKHGTMDISLVDIVSQSTLLSSFTHLSLNPKEEPSHIDRHSEMVFKCDQVLDTVHSKNVLTATTIKCPSTGQIFIVSSGADKLLRFTEFKTGKVLFTQELRTAQDLHSAPVIAIDADPLHSNRILTGSLNGSFAYSQFQLEYPISDSEEGEVGDNLPIEHVYNLHPIAIFTDHTKYVIHSKFSPDGLFFATGSYDNSIRLYHRTSKDTEFKFEFMLAFKGPIEALCFNPQSTALLVGSRNDNYLNMVSLNTGKIILKINMNENGDDFISFTPMCVSFVNDWILVSTDQESGRLIFMTLDENKMFKVGKSIYGPKNDSFSNPRHVHCISDRFLYVTSDNDYAIWIYDMDYGEWVGKLANEYANDDVISKCSGNGHNGIIRNLHFSKYSKSLISCGFDSTLRIWSA